ncbi:hypothetical protein ASPZODRAFT_56750 [Penicilliopsis zonata CBS 506.65]|uniref:Arb2 domain-containing protein n=1 Tax=Penicilliopsis zonata CBS 506.65 TaxID=1073090 RepID=A0A1L9SVZ5_9EURO|nr:hypothetical protein ASPZODRAFT_56750 [Penicilliopsis zonata CBS 506.65]OJJ51385.1 hypothetical protein ASPZODRAFT_56750 [Penicilliopsis zonata CBS 506.65]
MFVFRREDLPSDPSFPSDLNKLGYFINNEDRIRKISNPEQDFQFKINRNPRWNEAQREAMNECIRQIVWSRLDGLGLKQLRLPLGTPVDKPHVPILVSPDLETASRVVVVFGEPIQDLGVWAYRSVGTNGINAGSAVNFAREVLGHVGSNTALILANTGQLIWHCGSRRAVTNASWLAIPRESAVDPPLVMTGRNKIPGHHNWQEHVEYIFAQILAARDQFIKKDAKIDVIGIAEGGLAAVRFLATHWSAWSPYISAICLCNPLHYSHLDLPAGETGSEEDGGSSFAEFLSARCRAYVLSPKVLDEPVPGYNEHGCNCYSSGEELNIECIMPSAWQSILQWLAKISGDPFYSEPRIINEEDGGLDVGRFADDASVADND